jgi:hypothetical protein
MENKIDKLIDSVLETMPVFWDNPNGGHQYTCPFCGAYKEVKATHSVFSAELNHSEDCTYKLAQELYKLRS